jgi:hypothetical protein
VKSQLFLNFLFTCSNWLQGDIQALIKMMKLVTPDFEVTIFQMPETIITSMLSIYYNK